jgi:hypothetical protein
VGQGRHAGHLARVAVHLRAGNAVAGGGRAGGG